MQHLDQDGVFSINGKDLKKGVDILRSKCLWYVNRFLLHSFIYTFIRLFNTLNEKTDNLQHYTMISFYRFHILTLK